MDAFPILSILTFLPIVGTAIILIGVRGDDEIVARNSRWVALWTSLVNFFVSLLLWGYFDSSTAEFQFQEQVPWIPEFNNG